MLAEFSVVPIGVGSSIGDQLAVALRIVDESGMPYKVNPMGTVVEGEWDDIMNLIKRCRDEIMKKEDRVLISITVDDRKGKPNRIEEKVASVEKRLGKALKK
ncbi:MTH1187 family thiamine-binding protein [Dissulfurispira sp.]|uniref:MTH1187 family thiamine-binding protein n=1 Tax=Dissulfurispira sp. TaxID=2817609 RepID=UPI002FD9AFFE